AAGQAAAARIRYNAEQKQRGFLSREAGSGAQVGTGSLLEEEGRFAFNSELDAENAQFPHKLRAAQLDYQSDLFAFQKRQLQKNELNDVGLAGWSSGAKKTYSSLAANNQRESNALTPGTPYSDTKSGSGIIDTA